MIGSPGQRNDIAFAHDLIDGFEADAVYDADLYKERNRIERFFRQAQTVSTRRNPIRQTARDFMGFGKIAAIAISLK